MIAATELQRQRGRFFTKYPRLTLMAVSIVCILFLDFATAHLYYKMCGVQFWDRAAKEAERARKEADLIEKKYRIASNIYNHDLRKNFSGWGMWGDKQYRMFTDSLGFKTSKTTNTPLVSNNYRILFIGDSFTEGVQIEYQKTFVGIIAEKLAKKKIDVLNASASSYCPIIYWRKVKYLIEDVGLRFNEVIVFIDIADIDDSLRYYLSENKNVIDRLSESKNVIQHQVRLPESKNVIKDQAPLPENKNFIQYLADMKYQMKSLLLRNTVGSNTILLRLVSTKMHILLRGNRADPSLAINIPKGRWTVDKRLFHEYGEMGLNKAAYFMGLLSDLLKAHDIKLTIAVYPWPDQIVSNDLDSIQVSFWQKWAKERNAGFLNFFPYFIKLNNTETANKKVLNTFFIQGDVHLNEKGHKLIAESFMSLSANR